MKKYFNLLKLLQRNFDFFVTKSTLSIRIIILPKSMERKDEYFFAEL